MSVIAIILESIDILTTWYITSNGGVELNPLSKILTVNGFLIFKAITLIGLIIFAFLSKGMKEAKIFYGILAIVLFIAVVSNTIQIIAQA